MPSGQARHGPSASQSQPKIGPGSILTAQVPHNRKKAKRRAKEAAKKAAEQALAPEDSVPPPPPPPPPTTAAAAATMMKAAAPTLAPSSSVGRNGTAYNIPGAFEQNSLDSHAYHPDDLLPDDAQDEYEAANEEYYFSDAETPYQNDRLAPRSKSKKKKKKTRSGSVNHSNADDYYDPHHPYSNSHPPPPPPPPNRSNSNIDINDGHAHSRIWNTSGAEERENIKTFWLALDEAERRSLVKVEKEAVLKKMKEQQKHSCSCSVCGRKRIAIEEELEVLYDAYYEELEQYANHKVVLDDGTVITGPEAARAAYSSAPARLPPFVGQNGFQSRFHEEVTMEEDDEPDGGDDNFYSEDEDEEYDDDDGYDDEPPPPQATNFLNFGQSLTVRGGILTVADDLLKNDGKKFIEMMEQLAERRMRREEEAQYAETANMRMSHAHTHGPPLDEDEGYEDDEYATEEEGYPEDDLGEDELEDEDAEDMTEEQRMEEGRRMFQIFAARMFEQRVLTAYREKVARERQEKLLEELEDEKDQEAEKEAQKARKLAKAKEKKLKQKLQKEEEKAKKEAEKQASIDAAKAEEERKAEEQRKKKEEQKRKREEEKRRQEEERIKKEEDKKRKLAEAKKLQEEQERKLREQKDREKLKREEVRKREQEEKAAKAAKEKELRERKEREVVEKRERDAKAKAEKLAQTKKAEQARALLLQQQHQQQREHQQQIQQQIQSQQSSHQQSHPTSVAPMLRKQTSSASVPSAANMHSSAQASPHLQIATPVIPKAPSPQRPRQASQQGSSVQGSHQSSPKSGQVPSGSSATSPSTTQQIPVGVSQPHQAKNNMLPGHHHQHQQQHQLPPQPPLQNHGQPLAPPPGMPYPTSPAPSLLPNGFQSGFAPQAHVQHPRYPPGHDPSMFGAHGFGGPYRGFNPPHGMPYPPGINGFRGMPGPPGISSAGAVTPGGPGVFGMHSQGFSQVPGQRTQPHSRQASTTAEKASVDVLNAPAQPIAPPAPIKRPSSSGDKGSSDQADESKQLGSSALLDDDAPIDSLPRELQGGPAPFNSTPLFQEPFRGPPGRATFGSSAIGSTFHSPYASHNAVAAAGNAGWGGPAGPHFGGNMFAAPTAQRHQSRPVWLRMLAIEACNRLSKSPHLQATQQGGFHSIEAITNEVNAMKGQNEPIIPIQELLDICDTEGNAKNGGGTFVRTQLANDSIWIKFENDAEMPPAPRHSVGDIGSPLIGHASPAYGAPAPGFGGPRFAAPGSGVPGF